MPLPDPAAGRCYAEGLLQQPAVSFSPKRPVIAMMVVHAHTVMMAMAALYPYVHPRTCIPIVIPAMMVMAMPPLHAHRHIGTRVTISMVMMPVLSMLYPVSVTKVTGQRDTRDADQKRSRHRQAHGDLAEHCSLLLRFGKLR